jgi:osmotically inducible lipoprotein OsmB
MRAQNHAVDGFDGGKQMTPRRRIIHIGSSLAIAILATGCAHMSECERNTALGAAIGGVTGSVLTEGSTVGTVGGAVAGGVIGNRSSRYRC